MLKITLFLSISTFFWQLSAQNVSFLKKDNVWVESYGAAYVHGASRSIIDTLFIERDTTINSKSYQKIIYNRRDIYASGSFPYSPRDTQYSQNNTYGYFRENKTQLFFKRRPDSAEYLIYDFDNTKKGDTLWFMLDDYILRNYSIFINGSNPNYVTVDSIGTITLLDSIQRRIIYYTNPYFVCTKGWRIEGIGSNSGFLPYQIYFYPSGRALQSYISDKIRYDVEYCGNIYSSTFEFDEGSILIYPNPVNHILNLNTTNFNGKIKRICIFTQLGQAVQSIDNQHFNNSANLEISVEKLNSGLYFIQFLIEGNKQLIKKFVVEK